MPDRVARCAWVLGLIAVGLLSTCGDEGGRPRRDGGIDEVPCEPGAPFSVDGTFGVLATLNEHVEVLGLELEDPNPQAELLLLLELTQAGLEAHLTAHVCDIKIPEIQLKGQPQPILFTLEPDLLAAIPTLESVAELSGETTCATFTNRSPLGVVLGARLDAPLTDLLPYDAATQGCGGDPLTACLAATATGCICDQEGDGQPGASLTIENAPVIPDLNQVYVVLRTTVRLAGEVYSSDLIRGEVEATLEQSILDCHRLSGPCDEASAAAIRNINPSIEQDDQWPSTFVAHRLDGSYDCLRLQAERETLFPR